MDYEENLKELETIIEEMESQDIKLEDMVSKYKKAMELYSDLQEYLDNFEKEIKIISDKGMEEFEQLSTEE